MSDPAPDELRLLYPGAVVRRLPGGSPVPSWRVDTPDGPVAAKVHRDPAPARRAAALLRALAGEGVPVPDAHVRASGEAAVLVTAWADGRSLAEAVWDRPGDAAVLGEAFGRAHAALHAAPVPRDPDARPAFLRGAPGEREAVLHLDFHPENVFVLGARVSAVLDWENVRVGDPRADVARTLSILSVDPAVLALPPPARPAVRALRRGYLAGYAAAGGRLDGLAPFLAWAAGFLVRDLARREPPEALEPARRWGRRWGG